MLRLGVTNGIKCLLVIAGLAAAGVASSAPRWQVLGPPGGQVDAIATGPAGSGIVYALASGFGYFSKDGGVSWTVRGPIPDTSSRYGLKVRSDGQVFLYGYDQTWRSPDGMHSWLPYGSPPSGGEPIFDPRDPQTAVAVFAGIGWGYAIKQGDTNPWQRHFYQNGELGPTHFAFDPTMTGRLLGVGMVTETLCPETGCQSSYTLKLFKRFTSGTSWLDAGTIIPTQQGDTPHPCFPRSFSADTAGRLFIHTDCGFMRSTDTGATWQWLTNFPDQVWTQNVLQVDPSTAGRLIEQSAGGLYESRDAGDSWQHLPTLPDGSYLHVGTAGELWAAARDGAYVYDASSSRWLPRSTGLNSNSVTRIEPGFGMGTVLTAMAGDHAVQSLDDGLTWRLPDLGGTSIIEVARNATESNHLWARGALGNTPQTGGQVAPMFSSHDGGATWQALSFPATLPNGSPVTDWVPIGAQPGLVYGIENSRSCEFMICRWLPKGVAKSLDGGKTWSAANTGIVDSINLFESINRIVVSPANAQTALAYHETYGDASVHITRDGAQTWTKVASGMSVQSAVADPLNPARWYLLLLSGFQRTDDYGATWQTLAAPGFGGPWNNLLVDGNMNYAIGSDGAVAVSNDLGATWSRVLDGDPTVGIAENTARWGATRSTIYAAGPLGVVKLDLSATEILPRPGLWVINAENNGQSGRGFQVENQGGALAFTYYGYDVNGRGQWYLAAGALKDSRFDGIMTEYRGGTALGGAYAPALAAGNAGSVLLEFSSATAGTITLPGEPARAISKFSFGGASLPGIAPTNGLWIIEAENTGESGRGFQIEQNGGVLVFTYYGYAQDGAGIWYLAAGSLVGDQFTAPLVAYRGGTALGRAYAAATSSGSPGEVKLTFTSQNSGTITLPGEAARPMRKFSW